MSDNRIADLTFEELRAIIRQEIEQAGLPSSSARTEDDLSIYGDLADFPVDDVGPWPEDLNLNRQDFYDNDGQ
jgi:hypothetical protein